MSDCCEINQEKTSSSRENQKACPVNGIKGKSVQLITLKSLLKPSALEQLNPESNYQFCQSSDCAVVYFSQKGQVFTTDDVKVPVFHKDGRETTPVCYCFGWTRQRIAQEIAQFGESSAVASITTQVQAKRCGCEMNNPQGSYCLSNVKTVVQELNVSLGS